MKFQLLCKRMQTTSSHTIINAPICNCRRDFVDLVSPVPYIIKFLNFAKWMDINYFLIIVLSCISLVINKTEYLFTYLLAIFVSSFMKWLSIFCPFFPIGVIFFLNWFTGVLYIFLILIFGQLHPTFLKCLTCLSSFIKASFGEQIFFFFK